MNWAITVMIIVMVLLAALVAVFAFRLWQLRKGVPVLVRTLPADGDSGWRHGTFRYYDREALYYRLTSVTPGPDRRISRGSVEILGRRPPRGTELEIMESGDVVLRVRSGVAEIELGFDESGNTAFLSWVESRPSARLKRTPRRRN